MHLLFLALPFQGAAVAVSVFQAGVSTSSLSLHHLFPFGTNLETHLESALILPNLSSLVNIMTQQSHMPRSWLDRCVFS